ncbi:MAG: AbrB family transcriptional regulator [Peptococcaceae bacterium BRH_c4b]|nr:MAG: AbrB family transcriptional regulator [Peptococcaceae bacterium BRH_c4b]
MNTETLKVGQRGTVVIPVGLRKEYGLEEGTLLVAEPRPEGILLRPAVALSVEIYTPERKAQFLLNNAITAEEYAWALNEVKKLGLNPENIPHERSGHF